jgi:glycosyltransferase involved in cell wall biosynthesis
MSDMRVRTLSVVVPAYNEECSLARCVERVLAISDENLAIEILIVDDASKDRTLAIAEELAAARGALHTGFGAASGDYVAIQDADLEYDPQDLKRLLKPLDDGIADGWAPTHGERRHPSPDSNTVAAADASAKYALRAVHPTTANTAASTAQTGETT